VFLQYNYDISKVTTVSKNCFYPSPKVDSMVIKFKSRENKIKPNNESIFYKLIKDSFQFKRKNLKNNLKGYNLDKVDETLKKHNKNLTYRAESLTIEEFIDISNNL
jgi:16S rRNA (adenine1518-N6/adenine1519-N6)-dimethyltransferase